MLYRNQRRGGIVVLIIIVIAIAGVIYYVVSQERAKSPSGQARAAQSDPESALHQYLKTAYAFMHNEPGGTLKDVEATVTSEDWEWYQNNYTSLHIDAFDVGSGIDPTSADAIARRSVLRRLFEAGPNRTDTEVLSSNAGGDHATLSVKYLGGMDTWLERDVELVREGGYWKVKDFAGGRHLISGDGFF